MNQIHERILLTVDDGPSEKAGELMDYLKASRIGAILFWRGDYIRERNELAMSAVKDGYIIGNHSYDHQKFGFLAKDKVKEQIAKTDELIERVYGEAGAQRPAKYFRFPYGQPGANEPNQQLLRQYGYWSPINVAQSDWTWDIHVEDWKVDASNVAEKLERAKTKLTTHLRGGNVLLLHDHPKNVELELFQRICQHVLDLGFTFCTNENFHEQALIGPR